MGGIMLCSRQAAEPYYIDELNINIYSIEELAYYLYNHVYFVNKDFFNEDLVEYIRTQFKMTELADALNKKIRFKDSYAEMLLLIVKYADYYSKEELDDLEYLLEKIGNKTVDERMVLRAESFMQRNKYADALEIYNDILKRKRKSNISDEVYSQIWYQMGIINAHKFMYELATECFEKSCNYSMNEEAKEKMIFAGILSSNQKKLEDVASEFGISDEVVERCRLRISETKNEIKSEQSYVKFGNQLVYDGTINLDEYYTRIQSVLGKWKDTYREEMA